MPPQQRLMADLLDALCAAWILTETPTDVQFNMNKLALLRAAARCVPRHSLNHRTLEFYDNVFLHDVWADRGDT